MEVFGSFNGAQEVVSLQEEKKSITQEESFA